MRPASGCERLEAEKSKRPTGGVTLPHDRFEGYLLDNFLCTLQNTFPLARLPRCYAASCTDYRMPEIEEMLEPIHLSNNPLHLRFRISFIRYSLAVFEGVKISITLLSPSFPR